MQFVLLLLFISQKVNLIELLDRDEHFVNLIKRDVHSSSSSQNFKRYTKTYETGEPIPFDVPNFTLIDHLLTTASMNRCLSSVRDHTSWFTSPVIFDPTRSKQYTEIARYDSVAHRFILKNKDYTIDAYTDRLTLINTTDDHLLYTELSMHAESGISEGDAVLHDTYRFVRLLTRSMNCTTNLTIALDETIELSCSIEYEFLRSDHYQPTINMTFYIKQTNESMYTPIESTDVDERVDSNRTLLWKHSIRYSIQPITNGDHHREYLCIVISDSSQAKNWLEDETRLCRTQIHVRNHTFSTIISSNKWDFIDVLFIALPALGSFLFIVSLILCLIKRQFNRKRILQIKPENKTTTLPLPTKQPLSRANPFSNNNETLSESPRPSQHKPGCPKYIPSRDHDLLSSDLFTHTTIDNIKKIILPDIPQNNTDLFDDQTFIHFYIPSKTEKRPSAISIKDKSFDK